MGQKRVRELGITIGNYPTGPNNAITDVPEVLVGHSTIIKDESRIARTGVTAIVPRKGEIWSDLAFADYFSFNGYGEMTGMHLLAESGLLCYPILLTNTHQVGTVHEAVVAYGQEKGYSTGSSLPVVGETWDGWLNDLDAFHINRQHVYQAIESAHGGPVAEGNVGGGTGMICHDFKGGIGSSSRVVKTPSGEYTVGVLVQANHGQRRDLRVDGVPVGVELDDKHTPHAYRETPPETSSILMIIATDAPLLPVQCSRLARRASLGLARVGGMGHNGSGDIFLALATGNHNDKKSKEPLELKMLPHYQLSPIFEAVAESVEEAILNALTGAETMAGYQGYTAHALPLDALMKVMEKYGRG